LAQFLQAIGTFSKLFSTNVTTDHQKCTFFEHFSIFSIVLVQNTKIHSILFNTHNMFHLYQQVKLPSFIALLTRLFNAALQ